MKVLIRPLKNKDLSSVKKLNQENLAENYSDSFWLGLFKVCLKTSFVAELSGELIGYIIATSENTLPYCGQVIPDGGMVVSLAVDKKYRKLKIGAQLMFQYLTIMDGLNLRTYLQVHSEQIENINFYQKFGFEQVSILKNYYQSLEGKTDGLLMMRPCGEGFKNLLKSKIKITLE